MSFRSPYPAHRVEWNREHWLSRAGLVRFFAYREPVEVLMEACGTAHHWGRELESLGHRVTLLPATDVSRYRSGNKTDRADTKALLEAARNRAIRPVPVKSEEQQAVVALHRLRSGYVSTRTARINAVRGHLREFGVSIPLGARRVVPCARAALEDGSVPEILCRALREALEGSRAHAAGAHRADPVVWAGSRSTATATCGCS